MKTLKEISKFRETCKEYSNRKITEKDWEEIKDFIHWSPSSHGWEPYRVLTINRDSKLRDELFKPMLEQGIVKNADKILIFISLNSSYYSTLTDWAKERVERKAKLIENNWDEIKDDIQNSLHFKAHQIMMNIDSTNSWAEKQAYIGMSFGLVAAASLGIDSTPIEGMDRIKVKSVLLKHKLINDDESVAVALALGYRSGPTAFAHYGTGKRVRDSKDKKFKEV